MFGYGSDRPGPDDRLIADLEKSAKAATTVLLPHLNRGSVPAAQFDRLKSLYRAPLVRAPHAKASAVLLRAVKFTAEDLLLPAAEFVFEIEPVEPDGVTTRILHVVNVTQGRTTRFRVTAYGKYPEVHGWLVTPPCTMTDLYQFEVSDELKMSRAPHIGVLALDNEMYWAAAGLLVLAARARAERANPHH